MQKLRDHYPRARDRRIQPSSPTPLYGRVLNPLPTGLLPTPSERTIRAPHLDSP